MIKFHKTKINGKVEHISEIKIVLNQKVTENKLEKTCFLPIL